MAALFRQVGIKNGSLAHEKAPVAPDTSVIAPAKKRQLVISWRVGLQCKQLSARRRVTV